MHNTLLDRVRNVRSGADRSSSGRVVRVASSTTLPWTGAAGHGSRMPSQHVSTRFQRPY